MSERNTTPVYGTPFGVSASPKSRRDVLRMRCPPEYPPSMWLLPLEAPMASAHHLLGDSSKLDAGCRSTNLQLLARRSKTAFKQAQW